ncbi:hypothetical protein [Adhaeribacter aquaticus]|nr:hypothetical protein [Adhaeribacter aquaticus]
MKGFKALYEDQFTQVSADLMPLVLDKTEKLADMKTRLASII